MGLDDGEPCKPRGLPHRRSRERVPALRPDLCHCKLRAVSDHRRFADYFIVGFEEREDAERFLAEMRERFAKFSLELHPGKTRLIEFGRHAARRRAARGEGKPETFAFLGFTHICATSRRGRFRVRRKTDSKRMRAKLKMVKDQLRRRRYQPVPEQGRWLAAWCAGIRPTTPCPATTVR